MSNFVGVSTPYRCSSVFRLIPLGTLVCMTKIHKAMGNKLEVPKLTMRADCALSVPRAKAPASELDSRSISVCLSWPLYLPVWVSSVLPP